MDNFIIYEVTEILYKTPGNNWVALETNFKKILGVIVPRLELARNTIQTQISTNPNIIQTLTSTELMLITLLTREVKILKWCHADWTTLQGFKIKQGRLDSLLLVHHLTVLIGGKGRIFKEEFYHNYSPLELLFMPNPRRNYTSHE